MSTSTEHRRGSSGAIIDVGVDFDAVTSKFDTIRTGTRVREQGRWLELYPMKQLPEIKRIIVNGYEMETLTPCDVMSGDPMKWVNTAFDTYWSIMNPLTRPRQSHPFMPFVPLSVKALRRYVIEICTQLGQGSIGLALLSAVEDIEWPKRYTDWTHGDPIVDNLMVRKFIEGIEVDDHYVLIDPIPPTPAIPSHRMVDLGRFIQSAAGYEQIRYTNEFPDEYVWKERVHAVVNRIAHADLAISYGFNRDLVRQSFVYGIIGMLRGARTAETETRIMLIIQTQELVEELVKWMR